VPSDRIDWNVVWSGEYLWVLQVSQLKICFLGSASYPCPLDSTSEKKFKELTRLGEIFVIGLSVDKRPHMLYEHAHFYLIPYPKIRFLRYPLRIVLGFMLGLWCALRMHAQFIVAQSVLDGFTATGVKKAASLAGHQLILIVENHGDFELEPFIYSSRLDSSLYRPLKQWGAITAIKNADLFRAVSDSTRLQLAKWSTNRSIFQFPGWTDIDPFLQAGNSPARVRQQLIVFVGHLIPIKGVVHLVNAFVRLAGEFPAAELLIVGSFRDSAYVQRLQDRRRELDLTHRIEFAGRLNQPELAERLRAARVLILPSYSEGLGRVLFEAMAAGLPVIGSAVGGIPELLQEGKTGFLVEPGDENALEHYMRWILDHPQEADEMGRRGRAFAANFFSTQQYLEGYRQMLEVGRSLIG
jgi:glycosyltransferase involved in cell wall biosynthesis